MTDFDPTKHPRAAATGQFATKPQSAPETALTARTYTDADAIAAEVEARLDAEVHEDQCNCRSWPDSCVTYGTTIPWSHSDVDKIVRTTLAVLNHKPSFAGMDPMDKVRWIDEQEIMDQETADELAGDGNVYVVRALAGSKHRAQLSLDGQKVMREHADETVRVNFMTGNDAVSPRYVYDVGQNGSQQAKDAADAELLRRGVRPVQASDRVRFARI